MAMLDSIARLPDAVLARLRAWRKAARHLLPWAIVLATALSTPAMAQGAYPERPIRVVIGFAAGGGTDAVLRIVTQKMSAVLGVPVIVDNKPGANGNIATEIVSKAPADGYTLLYNTSAIVLSPYLYTGLTHDYTRDLTGVSLVANTPLVLVAHPSVPVDNIQELVKYLQANPDKTSYGSAGRGNISHLAMAQLLADVKASSQHVGYRSEAPAITDVLGGQIQFYFGTVNGLAPHIKQKKVKALAISGAARHEELGDVPTVAETVVPGFEIGAWSGLLAPAKTPKAVIDRVNAAVLSALRDPDTRARIVRSGYEVRGTSAEEYDRFIKAEASRFAQVIKAAGVKPE